MEGGGFGRLHRVLELDPEVGEGGGWQVQKGCDAQLCHFYQSSSKPPLICCHVLHSHCMPGTVRERGMLEAGRKQPSSCCSGQGSFIQNLGRGASLAVQWLRLRTPNAVGPGSTPGQGTRSHVPQLRPGAARYINK